MKNLSIFLFVVFAASVFAAIAVASDYIPEPQPVKSAVELSALYYPGTEQMAEWDMVEQTLPGIKPLLGWYDEGNPEVIDWQIKWAVEHGISSFCVDWYWNQGVQRLDHWVKGYYQARFRKYLKWYIMWANHNEPGAHSTADMIRVANFWIENYFKTPEYYTPDGKPVVCIWEVRNIDRDFIAEAAANGEKLKEGEGLKRALALIEKQVQDAGLPGVLFIQMNPTSKGKFAELARDAGCVYGMDYNFNRQAFGRAKSQGLLGPNDTVENFSYELMVKTVEDYWRDSWNAPSPVWPCIPCGWNDLPRSFQKAYIVRERTPERFSKICVMARKFAEENHVPMVVVSPINEWQEGTYIEPNHEYGFQMYDALRDAFCEKPAGGWPKNLVPSDVGRGPYDYPKMERSTRTEWTFDHDPQGWYRQPYGAGMIRVFDGALHIVRTRADWYAMRIRMAGLDTQKFKSLKVRMKISPSKGFEAKGTEVMRLNWGTPEHPIFDQNLKMTEYGVATLPIIPDDEWHEYTLPLSTSDHWTGTVNELWFDPITLWHAVVDVDWMKFE